MFIFANFESQVLNIAFGAVAGIICTGTAYWFSYTAPHISDSTWRIRDVLVHGHILSLDLVPWL